MKSSKENILEAVCTHFNYRAETIISQNRVGNLVYARQIYCYLCRELTKDSLSVMSDYIKRDHATALHSIKKITNLLSVYPEVKKDIKAIKSLLLEINPLIVTHVDLLQLTKNYTKSFV